MYGSYGVFRNDFLFSDVTLVSDDEKHFQSHRLILSRSSDLFKRLLSNPNSNPVFYLIGINSKVIESLLDFIYYGSITVPQNRIEELFEAAEKLKIQTLTKNNMNNFDLQNEKML